MIQFVRNYRHPHRLFREYQGGTGIPEPVCPDSEDMPGKSLISGTASLQGTVNKEMSEVRM